MDTTTVTKNGEKDWSEWQAVSELLAKLESTHSATCTVKLFRAGSMYTSFVDVDVSITVPVLVGIARPLSLSVYSHYPHPKHSSLASLVLELLLRADRRVGAELYKQRELPLTPPQE